MEVAPRIHRIEALWLGRTVCMYLFNGQEHALLVDTGIDGFPSSYVLPYLEEIGISPNKIRYVLTSHADADHSGGNGSMRDLAPNAIFMCHHLDQALIEDSELMISQRYDEPKAEHGIYLTEETKAWFRTLFRSAPIDLLLSGGEKIRLGGQWEVEIWHTPGHTRGHVSVYDASSKTLVVADSVVHNSMRNADGTQAFAAPYRYLDSYIATINRIQAADLELMLTCHFPVCRGAEIKEFLAESYAYVDRTEGALQAELKEAQQPMTMTELIAALAPKLGSWPESENWFLYYPLQGHLDRMVQLGQVKTGRNDGLTTFEWE
jgi:glyoxylase-like metal-dependent hydrolase (beta-lactamase superfamily II)